MSFNRIRELTQKSFARYSNIRLLYLFENMIRTIEEGTFSQLTNLEVTPFLGNKADDISTHHIRKFNNFFIIQAIDLSTNALTTIPMELLQMPLLRNLHINDNHLLQLPADLTVSVWKKDESMSRMFETNYLHIFFLFAEIGETNQSATATIELGQLSSGDGTRFRHSAKINRNEHLE